jgi:hypothetical protein
MEPAERPPSWEKRAELMELLLSAAADRMDYQGNENHPGGRFLDRLLLLLPQLIHDYVDLYWSGIVTEQLHRHVLTDRRSDFEATLEVIDLGMWLVLRRANEMALENGKEDPDEMQSVVVEALWEIARAAFAVIETLNSSKLVGGSAVPAGRLRRALRRTGKDTEQHTTSLDALQAAHIQRVYARMAASATSLRLALQRIVSRAVEGEEASNAARLRRYRARKRRRVAAVLPIEVYDDDIELLRQFGFLTAAEKSDQAAVAEALETFLMFGFLTYPDLPADPWRNRTAKQQQRISALLDREPREPGDSAEKQGPQ